MYRIMKTLKHLKIMQLPPLRELHARQSCDTWHTVKDIKICALRLETI